MMKEEMINQNEFITREQPERNQSAKKKQSYLTSIKKNYNFLFHPHKIDIPDNCTPEEYQQVVQEHYQEKAKLHKKLGAENFQKVVFKVEKVKYKVLKKFGNGFLKLYDKIADKKRDKLLKKKHCKEEVINIFRKEKMLLRKEMIYGQNRNYHMEVDATTDFMKYLDWNKQVHKDGLKSNGVIIAGAILGTIVGVAPIITIPLLVLETIGAGINAQCINLQEFNIARLKAKEDKLNKIRTKKMERDVAKYQQAAVPVTNALAKTKDLVSPEDIINNVDSVEQLEQLKKLIQSTQNQRNKTVITKKTK